MEDLNIVRSGIGMSQKTIGPFVKKDAEMIIDPKGFLNKEELEVQGYTVKEFNLEDLNESHSWNPYRALEQLEKEDPIKYQEVIKELESLIKKR
ncbi:hypothetical protein ACYSNW_14365 [Enterococcus sp. LJL99]